MFEKRTRRRKKNATGDKPTNRSNGSNRVPLCVRACTFVVAARSYYMYRERERERKKEKERRTRVHTFILQYSTLDNYDLWPTSMRAENIILSKDSRRLIVNNNYN
jgi:hypothetical protein